MGIFFTPIQHLAAVKKDWRPEIPNVRSEDCAVKRIYEQYISVFQQCWDKDPNKRPKASDVLAIAESVTVQHDNSASLENDKNQVSCTVKK